ncbi:MAG: YkgJ family cysteine cluster protein [Verrucomicrobia bacterium]|nr:YkgJ family cysteine cluster protein [Verrucomicrobiota bacterium]
MIERLCLTCGICCNGILFKDVELQPADALGALACLFRTSSKTPARRSSSENRSQGAEARPVRSSSSTLSKLPQPCPALGPDLRCRVYPQRPVRCHDFECALFQAVLAGRTDLSLARRVIDSTLQQADRVKSLLRQLGDADETLALSLRFQKMGKAIRRRGFDETTAALYADLTLAVHDLNMRLRGEFYPRPGD